MKCKYGQNVACEKLFRPNCPDSSECYEFELYTNADRIRAMSDEELAKALYRMQKDLCRYLAKAIGYTDPLEFDEDAPDILNWLQQTAEEDTK